MLNPSVLKIVEPIKIKAQHRSRNATVLSLNV